MEGWPPYEAAKSSSLTPLGWDIQFVYPDQDNVHDPDHLVPDQPVASRAAT